MYDIQQSTGGQEHHTETKQEGNTHAHAEELNPISLPLSLSRCLTVRSAICESGSDSIRGVSTCKCIAERGNPTEQRPNPNQIGNRPVCLEQNTHAHTHTHTHTHIYIYIYSKSGYLSTHSLVVPWLDVGSRARSCSHTSSALLYDHDCIYNMMHLSTVRSRCLPLLCPTSLPFPQR